jgi:hypothetical protein
MESIMDANKFFQMVLGSPAPVMNWWSRAICSSMAVWVAKNSPRSTSIGSTSGGSFASPRRVFGRGSVLLRGVLGRDIPGRGGPEGREAL